MANGNGNQFLAAIGAVIGRIPPGLQVVMALLAVATAGWTARGKWGEQAVLPAQVKQQAERIESINAQHTQRMDAIERRLDLHERRDSLAEAKLDRILCYAQAQAGERRVGDCIR